jgi:hypothetical protein
MPKLTFLQPGHHLEDILCRSETKSLCEQLTDHHLEDILQALERSQYASNSPIIIGRIFCRL